MSALKQTALAQEHRNLGGRMVDFGGWDLPIQYTSVMEEHQACRHAVGLFDVSHMGEVHVEGPDAEAYLNYLVTNDVSKLATEQAQYTVMCHANGGIVDDLVIYRRSPEKFLVVVNASNTDKDFAHMQKVFSEFPKKNLKLTNESTQYTQIAIQGRNAAATLQKLTQTDLGPIKTYWFKEGRVLNSVPAILARTGYTGEDGFEVYVPWSEGPKVWNGLLQAGQEFGIKPCGLGARDTLRMEMKYPLYGHELSDETNPLEAGLGWVVKLQKENFVGAHALRSFKEKGLNRKLVGLKMKDRGIARQDYKVFDESGQTQVGIVTSGTQAPSLQTAIAIAYVATPHAEIGSCVSVEVRDKKLQAEVIPTPFYKRPY